MMIRRLVKRLRKRRKRVGKKRKRMDKRVLKSHYLHIYFTQTIEDLSLKMNIKVYFIP
jgi:hypothetical protein